jgi:hypothetical protein
MPQFTDNKLAQLWVHLNLDYTSLVSTNLQAHEIYQELLNRVRYNLDNPSSTLYGLTIEEQFKVLTALNTFFQACPEYTRIDHSQKQPFFIFHFTQLPECSLSDYNRYQYCSTTDAYFTWMMLDRLRHDSYSEDTWNKSSYNKDKKGEAWAIFVVVILGALALGAALVALAYLFLDFFDNMERFWHNEGWMQAAISMLATAASGFATCFLTSYFLTAPLIALGLTAGLSNPVGLAIVGIVCLTIIGAGLGAFITNQIQNYAIKKSNPDALDPQDPHRFKLSEKESENLEYLGLDPFKVKCAMVTIRQQMGQMQVPSFLRRSSEKQELLNKVRQLRNGDLENGIMDLQADNQLLRFDLKRFDCSQVQPIYTQEFLYSHNQQFISQQSQPYQQQQSDSRDLEFPIFNVTGENNFNLG